MTTPPKLLCRGLSLLGLPPEGRLADALALYLAEIEAWNPAYGLVGATGDELIVKHVLDSLAPLSILRAELARTAEGRSLSPGFGLAPPRMRIADLGTGAGLPGIPLALALPETEVSLIDRMGKRIRFLESQKALLRLDNAEVIESEVERARGSYDLVTFRAFRPFERKLFKSVFALCESDGVVFAYKGRKDKAEAELSEIEGLYSSVRILPVQVPFLEDERCIVALSPA
ncbi:MAG TPA: 16S rRNA (guanine(527)-N(7))-methyltransferase RsmG [Rectinemataceae bacterium]|nr:16S rRNA (guanine(527)-N(7))-methyltransferase RsmG [Rectinemataceae bacterium]